MAAVVLVAWVALTAAELYRQGSALFENGKFAEAAALFDQARQLEPGDARVWKALGVSYAALSEYERANQPFERACTLDSRLADACYFYGRNLYALNRFEPALRALRKALPVTRGPWRVHLGIAQAFEALSRAQDAEPEFRKAVALYEGLPASERGRPDFDPRVHYATFLYRQGRLDESLRTARVVTASWPNYGRGHFEAGRALHQQGKLDEAASALEAAVKGGAGAQASLLLGRVYMRLGRIEEAQRHLKAGADQASVP